ncbi:uncharacterized protein LOC128266392 [Drosophila gunungcola]|uniref:Uncharacterized protein n=1 Tax=Drosophila gunungcola TaxID=103775 RepID=A0A9P9Z0U3_9MUSC|nr:uncharacterized protein LOC128266392 [Drosophila gunungcola]KAI8046705.1 hypothetical protein M5D96_002918 [Drosophila gunungcola]
MNSSLVILLISALALVQANTLRGSKQEDSSGTQEYIVSLDHPHSPRWPCEVAHYPEAYVLMHKVDKRLERIDSEDTKVRITNYAAGLLRQCILDGQMDEHCVKRSIGFTMSFIHHQRRQENRL